jgi:hypothetical protein
MPELSPFDLRSAALPVTGYQVDTLAQFMSATLRRGRLRRARTGPMAARARSNVALKRGGTEPLRESCRNGLVYWPKLGACGLTCKPRAPTSEI